MSLVNWTCVQKPKQLGGLGIGNLSYRNLALIYKWFWRFLTEPDALYMDERDFKQIQIHPIHN